MLHYILSIITFTPLLGSIVLLLLPISDKRVCRSLLVLTTGLTFLMNCFMLNHFNSSAAGLQLIESFDWVSSFKITYVMGIDGISVVLVTLTTLLFLLVSATFWESEKGARGFFSMLLLLETAVLGTFLAQDLFLFFCFWGASLLPIYFMVGVWGNKKCEYAASKFFIYQLVGCALVLLGMLAVYYSAEPHTFNMIELGGGKFASARLQIGDFDLGLENVVFGLLVLGFLVRMPIVPFHSWLPHLAVEAPPALTVVLMTVFLKTAAYALIRVNYGLFPSAAAWFSIGLAVAGTVNLIYGAVCAFGQRDIRKIGAYSSVSHMGFILLGLAIFSSAAFQGAILQMVAHALYAGLFYFLIGVLGERAKRFDVVNEDGTTSFGGLVVKAPILAGFFTVAVFSVIGVPGLAGFPASALVFLGSFPSHRLLTVLGLLGVLLSAGYMIWVYRRLLLGTPGDWSERVSDVTPSEQIYLVPLVLLCVMVGVYPRPILDIAQPTVEQLLSSITQKGESGGGH